MVIAKKGLHMQNIFHLFHVWSTIMCIVERLKDKADHLSQAFSLARDSREPQQPRLWPRLIKVYKKIKGTQQIHRKRSHFLAELVHHRGGSGGCLAFRYHSTSSRGLGPAATGQRYQTRRCPPVPSWSHGVQSEVSQGVAGSVKVNPVTGWGHDEATLKLLLLKPSFALYLLHKY